MSYAGSIHSVSELAPHGSASGRTHRPTAAEYAAYSAILRDLDYDRRNDLATKLLRERQPRQRSRLQRQPRQTPLSPSPDDLEDDQVEVGEDSIPSMTATSLRRVDGPIFTPVYQDAVSESRKRKRREPKLRSKSKSKSTTLWPLALNEYPSPVPPTLEEAIMTFASSYIRTENLALRGNKTQPDDIDEFPVLPDDFIPSVVESIGKVLVRLAAARPVEVKQRRETMARMDWSSVLSLASMERGLNHDLLASNSRLRDLYHTDEPNVLSHRLAVLDRTPKPVNPAESFYASIMPKQDRLSRPHQSKAEIAMREQKRKLKVERMKRNKSDGAEGTKKRQKDRVKARKTKMQEHVKRAKKQRSEKR